MRRTLTLHDGRHLATRHIMPDAVIREVMRYAYDDGHGAYAAGQRYGIHVSTVQGWNRRAATPERIREQVQMSEMRRLQLMLSVETAREREPRRCIGQYERPLHTGFSHPVCRRIGRVRPRKPER